MASTQARVRNIVESAKIFPGHTLERGENEKKKMGHSVALKPPNRSSHAIMTASALSLAISQEMQLLPPISDFTLLKMDR